MTFRTSALVILSADYSQSATGSRSTCACQAQTGAPRASVYRTSKKNDRIDARKQAVLLSIGEVPKVHIPTRQVRQWRATIQQRRGIVHRIVSVKNRIRASLKANGSAQPLHKGSWWKVANLEWMRQQAQDWTEATSEELWRVHLSSLPAELELLGDQLKSITQYLDRTLAEKPGGTLLMSSPGSARVQPRRSWPTPAMCGGSGAPSRTRCTSA